MRINALCTNEETKTGVKNGKPWSMTFVTLIDKSKTPRCKTAIEVTLGDEDKDQIGQLEDSTLLWDITELESGYKGSIRGRAHIVRVAAPPVPPQAPAGSHLEETAGV